MREAEHVATTRAAYDATADLFVQFIGTEITPAIEAAVDRALLEEFAERISRAPAALVGDVGCGPGRVAAFLAARGLEVVGFDVSQSMLGIARAAHPGIRFDEGLLSRLPVPDGSLAGAVCWYSIIHTPPDRLDEVVSEMARVLKPGGPLLIAFQVGRGEPVHRTAMHGRPVSLTSYRHDPSDLVCRLAAGGFEVEDAVIRAAAADHESTPQAFVSARATECR